MGRFRCDLNRAIPRSRLNTTIPEGLARDTLMSRGKNCLPTVSRQFLTRNYPRPNCLLKCLPNCLSPTREGFLSSFKINPAVRVIARQVRDKNCLAAIFAPRHQSVSSGPLGLVGIRIDDSESILRDSTLLRFGLAIPRPWCNCQNSQNAQKCSRRVLKVTSGLWGETPKTVSCTVRSPF